MENHTIAGQNLKAQRITLYIGVALLGIKFFAWWMTASNAILTDAAESIVNVLAALLGLYSIYLSSQPRDQNHPYGHGKVEFISASVEGVLILIAGLVLIIKSVYNLVNPVEVSEITLGIYLVAFAGIVNFAFGTYLQNRGKQVNSLALEASGKHLRSDGWSSAGLVAGLVIYYFFPLWWLDSVLAIIFGGVIAISGYRILRRSVAGIMDEADIKLLNALVKKLNINRRDPWIDIHNFRVVKYGPQLHIDAHLTLPYYYKLTDVHDEVEELNNMVDQHCGSSVEMFVHVDPCNPRACRYCAVEDCPFRKEPYTERIIWTMDVVTKNQQHAYQLAQS